MPKKDYNFLCFSHGVTLKEHFLLESYLKNTEILHYNVNNKETRRILNNIVINKNVEDICGSLYTPKYKMFKIIDNYFINKPPYKINTDINIDDNFKVSIFDERYKHKYLKYKHKYLKYKHKI